MKIKMRKLFSTAALVLCLLAVTACSKSENGESQNAESEKLIQTVRAEPLLKSKLRKFIEINGNIRAEKSTNVYPVIQGKIAGTKVHLGSQVNKGDVIAYVDPSVPGSRYSLNEVTSPISGTVISIPLKEGTKVDTDTSLVTIGDLSKLQIITYIPERYVSFLKKGLDADVILEAYPDEKFTATVSEVSPVLDESTRTKEVILNFSKNDSRINAGMFAAVNLYLKTFENVYSVPSSCIVEKGQKKFIYLINDEGKLTAHFAEIKTKEEITDRTIIEFVESVNEGAKVITQGFENLQEGSQINIAGE